MSDSKGIIVAALITAIVSLVVSIINIWNSRSVDKKKLQNAIKSQELQTRLAALHLSIEGFQKTKNRLKDILIDYETNNIKPISYYTEAISEIVENYQSIYSSHLSSLWHQEQKLIHDGSGTLIHIRSFLYEAQKAEDIDKNHIDKNYMEQEIHRYRKFLDEYIDSLKKLRKELVKSSP